MATVLSVTLHAAVLVAMVVSGQRVAASVRAFIEETVRYLYPADHTVGAGRPALARESGGAERRAFGSQFPPWNRGTVGTQHGDGVSQRGLFLLSAPLDGSATEPGLGDGVYSDIEVDSVAVRDPASAAPEYPPALIARRIEGGAVFRFEVDSTGAVDMATVRVMSATHPLFARAVREVLPKMKFRPARIGDRTVRQLVDQPFSFKLVRPPTHIS